LKKTEWGISGDRRIKERRKGRRKGRRKRRRKEIWIFV
jgi:hypothetical protein